MQYANLSSTERVLYAEAVAQTHSRRVELRILDRDGKEEFSLSSGLLSGQVDVDLSRSPAMVLTCDVFDGDDQMDWRYGEHLQHQARIVDSRFVPTIGDGEWVDVVVFTGPLHGDFSRVDRVVSLTAQSAERLAMGSVRQAYEAPRKTKATKVIRDMLKAAGTPNRRLIVPDLKPVLPERVTVGVVVRKDNPKTRERNERRTVQRFRAGAEDTYWPEAERVAAAIDRVLYADGEGRFVLRSVPTRPIAKVTNRLLTSVPTEKRNEGDGLVNTWRILGHNPKGPKKQIRATIGLPKRHPNSADSLAVGGKPYQLIRVVKNKHLRSRKAARAFGKRLRDNAAREQVAYEVQMVPVMPWLLPYQIVTVATPRGAVQVRATQWTLPLGPGADSMTLGATVRRRW